MPMRILYYESPQVYLQLPFVPTETGVNRNFSVVEILPPGMSSGFVQYTQGGLEKHNFRMLLNDVGRREQDKILLQNVDGIRTTGNVANALKWLTAASKPQFDPATNKQTGAPILLLQFTERASPIPVVLTRYTRRILLRADKDSALVDAGEPTRAVATLEFTEYNKLPLFGGVA